MNLDKTIKEALTEQQRKRAMLALEANIAYFLVSMSIEETVKILREQAQYLEDHC